MINDARNDKDAGRLLYRIFTSLFIARVRKGCVWFYCERELETEHNWNILTPKLWPSALCLSRSHRAAQPEPWSPLCWVLAFYYYTLVLLRLQLYYACTQLSLFLFNSSALYYLQTPTRWYGHASTPLQLLPISGDRHVSLTLSLEWPVWSSSSGNSCHAVQRSLSSGASVYEIIFSLVPFHQPISAHAISSHNCH